MVPLVDRRFEAELTVGDVIHVPSLSNLGAARTKSSVTAITFVTVTETNTQAGDDGFDGVSITVTTHDYNAIAIESIAKLQTDRDLMAAYAGKLGYSLGLSLDDSIAVRMDAFSNTVGSLAVSLSDDDILSAIQFLDDADAPQEERNMVVSPKQAIEFLKLDRFVHNDYSTLHASFSAMPGLGRAYVTSYLGIPVFKTNNVDGTNAAGHDNALLHRESIALIVQQMPKSYAHFDIDFLADKIAIEQVYGSSEVRDDHGVFLAGA